MAVKRRMLSKPTWIILLLVFPFFYIISCNYDLAISGNRNLIVVATTSYNSNNEENIDPEICKNVSYKYKYINLLLQELHINNIKNLRKKTNLMDIYRHFDECNKNKYLQHSPRKQLLVKFKDGIIYTNISPLTLLNSDMYEISILMYLYHLQNKYSLFLPNTYFFWYFHDFRDNIDWLYNDNVIPIFWSDIDISYQSHLPLFIISRSYLKYFYFTDLLLLHNKNKTFLTNILHKILSKLNKKISINDYKIADYTEFNRIKNNKSLNNLLLKWENKLINKAIFHGRADNGKSRKLVMETLLSNDYIYNNITKKYFDIEDYANMKSRRKQSLNLKYHRIKSFSQLKYISIYQQLKYKYFLCLDGISVRDSLIFHLLSGSIMLKQESNLYEWWYYDLIDHKHLIKFKNVYELMDIMVRLINNSDINVFKNIQYYKINNYKTNFNLSIKEINAITNNAKVFMTKNILNKTNIDCFMLKMITIYNKYLFDSSSMINDTHNELNKFLYPIDSLII